jgi:hypothetical protein
LFFVLQIVRVEVPVAVMSVVVMKVPPGGGGCWCDHRGRPEARRHRRTFPILREISRVG